LVRDGTVHDLSCGRIMRKIAKIILFVDDEVLFAIKKAPHESAKDGKLELPGGGLEKGEQPIQGLCRELVEEEASQLVARKVAVLGTKPVEFKVEGDHHFIYHMPITHRELARIRMKSEETYGYKLIPRSTIENPAAMDDQSVFTRRTVKIFHELRRRNHFPYGRD